MSYLGIQQKLNQAAFGELLVVEPSGRVQIEFIYGIDTNYITTTVTGSGTVTSTVPFAVLSTTAATSSSAKFESKSNLHYRPGQGATAIFTSIFSAGVANSLQYIGLGDDVDGFFFGYNGTQFGILHRNNSVDTWIPQTTWNLDKFDGTGSSGVTLDPTKGNVFKIQFQWLGFGNINFYIENEDNGNIIACHQIKYANLNTIPSLSQPSLPLQAKVVNTSNNTNVVLKTSSLACFIEGRLINSDVRFSANATRATITTQINVLSILNKSTFLTSANKKVVIVDSVSLSNSGTPDATYRLYINTTLGGSPSYTDVNATNSVVSFDVAGTTVTGGRNVLTFYVAGNGESNINLKDYNIILNPSDILTVSSTSSGASITSNVSLSWREQF